MAWLKKIISQLLGQPTLQGLELYKPENIGVFDDIYQSTDFPHVFLGAGTPEDIQRAEEKAGERICVRIDVAALSHLMEDLPKADIAIPLPEYPRWTEEEHSQF